MSYLTLGDFGQFWEIATAAIPAAAQIFGGEGGEEAAKQAAKVQKKMIETQKLTLPYQYYAMQSQYEHEKRKQAEMTVGLVAAGGLLAVGLIAFSLFRGGKRT